MNICIVNIRENNPLIGGVEKVSFELGNYWHHCGHKVIFLSRYCSGLAEGYESGCEEYFLPDSDVADTKRNEDYTVHLLKSKTIDYVINQGSVFEDLCQLCYKVKQRLPIRLITAIHYDPLCRIKALETSFFIRERLGGSLRLWLIDFLLYLRYHLVGRGKALENEKRAFLTVAQNSDAVVLLSGAFLGDALSLTRGQYENKFYAIPNPILRKTDNGSALCKKKQIIYVGRIEFGMKRTDRILRIWRKLESKHPDWKCKIIGDGGIKKSLENTARKYRLKNLCFEGVQNPEKYYAESEILCMTSTTEGFGMVLIEALQYKCIPVSYRSYASLDDIVIDGVNGCTIAPFDENEYVRRLDALMSSEEERERLASNNGITLGKFDIDRVSVMWIDLFSKLEVEKR